MNVTYRVDKDTLYIAVVAAPAVTTGIQLTNQSRFRHAKLVTSIISRISLESG